MYQLSRSTITNLTELLCFTQLHTLSVGSHNANANHHLVSLYDKLLITNCYVVNKAFTYHHAKITDVATNLLFLVYKTSNHLSYLQSYILCYMILSQLVLPLVKCMSSATLTALIYFSWFGSCHKLLLPWIWIKFIKQSTTVKWWIIVKLIWMDSVIKSRQHELWYNSRS